MNPLVARSHDSFLLSKEYCESSSSIKASWYGEHWSKFYLELDERWNEFLASPDHALENFRQSKSLSAGLDDSINQNYKEQDLINLINLAPPGYVESCLTGINIGNCPYLQEYNNKFYDDQVFGLIFYLLNIKNSYFGNISNPSNLFCCEIGAGYGEMARLILEDTNCKYQIIDLPEANALSTYYLGSHFPDKRFFTYKDYLNSGSVVSEEVVADFDVFILPPGCNYSSQVKFDFFLNMRSMGEMSYKQLHSYFDFIQAHRANNAFFANINRYAKSTAIYKYPYDKQWDTRLSVQSGIMPMIHMLFANYSNSAPQKPVFLHQKDIEIFYKKNHQAIRSQVSMKCNSDGLR